MLGAEFSIVEEEGVVRTAEPSVAKRDSVLFD